MLALARGLQYIHEPFNPVAPAGVCAADFDHYFVYVTRCNETRYLSPLSRTLAFRYSGSRRHERPARSAGHDERSTKGWSGNGPDCGTRARS